MQYAQYYRFNDRRIQKIKKKTTIKSQKESTNDKIHDITKQYLELCQKNNLLDDVKYEASALLFSYDPEERKLGKMIFGVIGKIEKDENPIISHLSRQYIIPYACYTIGLAIIGTAFALLVPISAISGSLAVTLTLLMGAFALCVGAAWSDNIYDFLINSCTKIYDFLINSCTKVQVHDETTVEENHLKTSFDNMSNKQTYAFEDAAIDMVYNLTLSTVVFEDAAIDMVYKLTLSTVVSTAIFTSLVITSVDSLNNCYTKLKDCCTHSSEKQNER